MPEDIDSLFAQFSQINPNFDFNQIREKVTQYENTYRNGKSKIAEHFKEKINKWNRTEIQGWLGVLNGRKIAEKQSNLSEILAVVRRAVFLTYGFELKLVQFIAVIILLEKNQNLGRLLEITTGEGKSITIAVLAAIKVFLGKSVDIITTSDILAVRDATNNESFFKLLGIKVSNNVNEKDSSKPKNCYKCSVVYGSANSFQGDILQDEYYLRDTLNKRKPEAIIIDEVDSMFIDEFSRSTYISDPKPGFEKLNFVFFIIWKNLEIFNEEECKNESEHENIYERIETIVDTFLKEDQFNQEDKTPLINLPDYLKEFIKKNLRRWIRNSISARFDFHLKRDYIIDKGDIVPVDQENTGVIQNDTKYGNGLHQFLQIKHQLKLTYFSLISNYLSNIGFFKRYISDTENNICGLTGTLGSDNCKKMLDNIYHVDFAKVPTSKPRNFIELDGLIMENEDKWLGKIYDSAREIVNKKRAMLILAESIDSVEKIKKYFINRFFNESDLIVYKRNDVDQLPEQTLAPRKVILSTNLAGRGVDIKLEKSVVENGGLHVCLTFLSINTRVELQAFGRAARQGERGTGQLILNYQKEIKICNVNHCNVNAFKILRDEKEQKRLEMSVLQINRINIEDELFKRFVDLLKEITNKDIYKIKTFEKTIIRDAIEERWALWFNTLDQNLSKAQVLCNFNEFKQSIMSDLAEGKNNFRVIQNSHYIDRICFSAIQSKQSKAIKYLRQPIFTTIKEIGGNILYGEKEYTNMNTSDLISLCEESIQKNPGSFIGNMNKAVCLIMIIKEKEKEKDKKKKSIVGAECTCVKTETKDWCKLHDTVHLCEESIQKKNGSIIKEKEENKDTYYIDAKKQYELAIEILDREIAFWLVFKNLLEEEMVKNKPTCDMIDKKIELYTKINDCLIKNNIEKINQAVDKSKRSKVKEMFSSDDVILVEMSLNTLLISKEDKNELKLKGLECLYIIKEKVSRCTITILFVVAIAELVIGFSLLILAPGFLKILGVGLITEGISDFINALYVVSTGEFNLKEYLIKKGISLCFSMLFVTLGSLKFLKSEWILKVLKKSPLTHLKVFIKEKFGYDIKALTLKFTASLVHIKSEIFLMCISMLSRKIHRKKEKLNQTNLLNRNELSKKLNNAVKAKLSEINRTFAERARQLDRSIDQIDENNEISSTIDVEIPNIITTTLDALFQIDAIEQRNNTNNEASFAQNEVRIVQSIQNVREYTEEAILTQEIVNIDFNADKTLLEETTRTVVQNALTKVKEKLEEINLKKKEVSIEAQLDNRIRETQDPLKRNELCKLKEKFNENKQAESERYRKYLNSEKLGEYMIEITKNKLRETLKNNLIDEMKKETNKSLNEMQIVRNAYTSNGDITYEYNSMDIEYISTQLLKEHTFASNILLCKPTDKSTVQETLNPAKLGKYNMIFYDIGNLKWVAFFIIIENEEIIALCKCPNKLDAEFEESIETIKTTLEKNYPGYKLTVKKTEDTTLNDFENAVNETGIQSLWNMKIIADEVSKDPSSIVDNFNKLNFNDYYQISLRDQYAELFAINFLEVEFDKFILFEKSDQIKEHHKSQLEDLIKFFENLNAQCVLKSTISTDKMNLEGKVIVDLHIDHIDASGQMNTIDYNYSYLLDFQHIKDETFKKDIMEDINTIYSGSSSCSNHINIPSNINTNGFITIKDKLKLTLYDEHQIIDKSESEKKEGEEEKEEDEDSVFCVNNFLIILASLQCEDAKLNEHLAVNLFKKTKFYSEKRGNIVENFNIITRMLNETQELFKEEIKKKEEMKKKLEKSPMDDDDYLSMDELEYQKKREDLIMILRSSNVEPTEELIEKLMNNS